MISQLAIASFALAGAFGVLRILVGPSLADRVIALDVTLISLMGAIAVDAARRDDTTNLIVTVVLAIIGFTATVAASQFVERREPAEPIDVTIVGVAADDRDSGESS